MRSFYRGLAVAAICGAGLGALPALANAKTLSFGPKGTVIDGSGVLNDPYAGRVIHGGFTIVNDYRFGRAEIYCDRVDAKGTLTGSPSSTLSYSYVMPSFTFAGCHAQGLTKLDSYADATISFASGSNPSWDMVFVLDGADANHNGRGKIAVGHKMKITSGACTIETAPSQAIFESTSAEGNSLFSKDGFSVSRFPPNSAATEGLFKGAYTGSAGCYERWRGTHATGFGIRGWKQSLPGLLPTETP